MCVSVGLCKHPGLLLDGGPKIIYYCIISVANFTFLQPFHLSVLSPMTLTFDAIKNVSKLQFNFTFESILYHRRLQIEEIEVGQSETVSGGHGDCHHFVHSSYQPQQE